MHPSDFNQEHITAILGAYHETCLDKEEPCEHFELDMWMYNVVLKLLNVEGTLTCHHAPYQHNGDRLPGKFIFRNRHGEISVNYVTNGVPFNNHDAYRERVSMMKTRLYARLEEILGNG